MAKLTRDFFTRDCLTVSRELVGKLLCRKTDNGILRLRISETEAYCGEEDTACHAHRGRTPRTEVFYKKGGTVYVYLCYGIHWLVNIVTGAEEQPEAVLIRACVDAQGPAKLTKKLGIDKSFNLADITDCDSLWIEDDGFVCDTVTAKRVGIDFAEKQDVEREWRFVMVR